MSDLIKELQTEYGYSDYDIAKVKYVLTCIFSELSKLIIFGIIFGLTGYFASFIISLILLLFLRINIGGFHCKHYISCLLLTSVILYASIVLLPNIMHPSYILILIISAICMIVNYSIGPICSPFRPSPDSLLLKHCRNNGFIVIFIYVLFVSIFQNNTFLVPYIYVGFWTIVLHTVQLIIAKLLRKRGFY